MVVLGYSGLLLLLVFDVDGACRLVYFVGCVFNSVGYPILCPRSGWVFCVFVDLYRLCRFLLGCCLVAVCVLLVCV